MNQSYEITIQGHLTPDWAAVFDGMELVCQNNGCTLITGDIPDQASLYGLLNQLRDLGITLISVNKTELKK
jgi:hypothetical protein